MRHLHAAYWANRGYSHNYLFRSPHEASYSLVPFADRCCEMKVSIILVVRIFLWKCHSMA